MEEVFQVILAMILVALALARKNQKKKAMEQQKKSENAALKEIFGDPQAPAAPEAPDQPQNIETAMPAAPHKATKAAGVKPDTVAGIMKQLNLTGIMDMIEGADKAPAEGESAPVMPVAPPVDAEGECAHPEHAPEQRMFTPRIPEPNAQILQTVSAPRERRTPEVPRRATAKINAAELRRAVITAEILDRPVALRGRKTRI